MKEKSCGAALLLQQLHTLRGSNTREGCERHLVLCHQPGTLAPLRIAHFQFVWARWWLLLSSSPWLLVPGPFVLSACGITSATRCPFGSRVDHTTAIIFSHTSTDHPAAISSLHWLNQCSVSFCGVRRLVAPPSSPRSQPFFFLFFTRRFLKPIWKQWSSISPSH